MNNLCGICCCCQSKNENLESQLPESRKTSDANSNKSPRATNITKPEIFVDPQIDPNDKNKPIFVLKPESNSLQQQQPITTQPSWNNNTNINTNKNDSILYAPSSVLNNSYKATSENNNCTIQITTYENGQEVKKVIELKGSTEQPINLNIGGGIQIKNGIENKSFEMHENNNMKQVEQSPKIGKTIFEEKRQMYENIIKNINKQNQTNQNMGKNQNLEEQQELEKKFEDLFIKTFGNKSEKLNDHNVKSSNFIQKNPSNVESKPIFVPHDAFLTDNISNIRLSCLEMHNRFRAKHGCPTLKESDKLNKLAEDWANYLMNNNKFEYNSDAEYGQNLYNITSSNATHVTMAVQFWYDEIKYYNFNNPNPTEMHKKAGGFSQVIWKDSCQLGTGVVKRGDKMIVVCFYYPPGNYRDQFNDYMIPPLINEEHLTNRMIERHIEQIRESSLRIHNRLRALHGCPSLKRSIEFDKKAEETIDYIEANNGKMPVLINENFTQSSLESDLPFSHITEAVLAWYDLGGKEYNYDGSSTANNVIEKCFAAIIYRDTIFLGTAVRRIGDKIRFICVYCPSSTMNAVYKDYLIPRPITDKLYLPLDDYPDEMRWSCLKAHNYLRSLHGCPPLIGNPKLDKCAEEWAEHLAMTKQFYHRPNNKYGENLFWTSDQFGHVTIAVQDWYDEIKLYNYEHPKFSKGTGHFTQLIWKDCMELGTAIARRNDRLYVVCVYDPPGNVDGRFNDYYVPRKMRSS